MTAVVIGKRRGHATRGVDRLARLAGATQLDESDAQAHVGQRQLGIVLQRDVNERAASIQMYECRYASP